MYVPMQNTVADYYPAHYTLPAARERVESLGALDLTAPGLAAIKFAKMRANAVGADEQVFADVDAPSWMMGATGLLILGAVAVVAGALNYQMGKAMAPSADKRKTWGWIGVPLGFVPLGLPIMAIVSNSKKG